MSLYLGQNKINEQNHSVKGDFVTIEGERYYKITNFDELPPFFITLSSASDHFSYLGSGGALTCGRVCADKVLFPYDTDDKILLSGGQTGPVSLFKVSADGEIYYLWQPFVDMHKGVYDIERSIAKSLSGNKIIFIEENKCLGVRFSYQWASSHKYGWVRKSKLENLTTNPIKVELLDGFVNLMPANVDRVRQNAFSTLVDAYKVAEVVPQSTMALYRMEATLVDRAEASEALAANVVFSLGLDDAELYLSPIALNEFRCGKIYSKEAVLKGQKGAYLLNKVVDIEPNNSKEWFIVADVEKDAVEVRELISFTKQDDAIKQLNDDIELGTEELLAILAQNDGIMHTADVHRDARHALNTLYNSMRGGYYFNANEVNIELFKSHLQTFNTALAAHYEEFLNKLPQNIDRLDFEKIILKQEDADLYRLFLEYLPITFARRHGDPSRPWNLFNIKVKDREGNPLISYQGNWRDIFQNWEALSLSYPAYLKNIIAKFLNATTIDGYNPYKVSSEGFDWEVIDPENPWSNIGYWGDHQLIYLIRLLEMLKRTNPRELSNMLTNEQLFAFANVPYRIKSYQQIKDDPRNTISFNNTLNTLLNKAIEWHGKDATLVQRQELEADNELSVLTVSFMEKILITMLAKLSNLIPDAGVWMNTLRPEWNDANNALVGNGASVVTLCHLRRFIIFFNRLDYGVEKYELSTPLVLFYHTVSQIITRYLPIAKVGFTPKQRDEFVDQMGMAAEQYRQAAYCKANTAFHYDISTDWSLSSINVTELKSFFANVLELIDYSLASLKRENGLYEAYMVAHFNDNGIEIEPLYDMLEGQVAILSACYLNYNQTVELLKTMRESALYRADQRSYMLYPDRELPLFFEKNNIKMAIEPQLFDKVENTVIIKDSDGEFHFAAHLNNEQALGKAIKLLNLTDNEVQQLFDIYEDTFNHLHFTGRSGTMYKYEGLGCIYWHQVSKLLLAVGENIEYLEKQGTNTEELKRLYWEIEEGIGASKSPDQYGSFPFDAYSHTPKIALVQQPGMTGQVKEDIISRFFQLGVRDENGVISFTDSMFDKALFGEQDKISFTYCGVEIVYVLSDADTIAITYSNDCTICYATHSLSNAESQEIFNHTGKIKQIEVSFKR